MSRLSTDEFYMEMAYLIAEQSTCVRRKVGSVIVKDKMVLSTGYNGAPIGIEHCTTETCIRLKLQIPSGQQHEKCVTGDMVVKLLDGTYKTIKELADNGEDIWVYSIDTNTGKIVPGLAINPHFTGYRDDIIKITFDNGKSITCTSDHKILMRDCNYKEAKDLIYGDSCMPIYYNRGKNNNYHEIIQNIKKGKGNIQWKKNWKCNTHQIKTHEMVYRHIYNFCGPLGKNIKNIHHKDENKWNNLPNNLDLLTKSEHTSIHNNFALWDKEKLTEISKKGGQRISELAKEARDNGNILKSLSIGGKKSMTNNWNNSEWKQRALIRCRENFKKGNLKSNKDPKAIKNRRRGSVLRGLSYLIFKCNENNEIITNENYRKLCLKYAPKSRLGEKGSKPPKLDKILNFYNSLQDALEEAKYYNHKVIKVEYLKNMNLPVYDLSVPEFGNFALDLGDNSCVVISNCRGAHSESNAIAQAARNGVNINNATIYCTTQPCIYCAKAIVNSGIKRLVFCEAYGDGFDELTKEMLQNIEVVILKRNKGE